MAQSDARFGYRAKLDRNAHDLSQHFGFTAVPGMLLPIFADIATPKDTYYIQHDMEFLRTRPLSSPAMVDVKIHFETFFVPFQMIYQPIENTLFSTNNAISSFFNYSNMQNNNFPLLDYKTMRDATMGAYNHGKEHSEAFRLTDMLGLNGDSFAYDTNNPSRFNWVPDFFPWQLLAYHTIFNYYYRLDDKSQFNNETCNWDNHYADTTHFAVGQDILKIHQRPWEFDYFTSSYRSPIVSNANLQQILPTGLYQEFISTGDIGKSLPINSVVGVAQNNESIRSFSVDSNNNPLESTDLRGGLNTAMIRQMFANEKLAMITGRARKTYDAQVLAHYGVEVPHDPKHDIALIGRDTYDLRVGEVTSLASSSTAGLGDLAGKGWSQGEGKKYKFTAPCHGIVMTIFSIEPKKRYYGGFDRVNDIVDAFDIPVPEFDRLGNQPMFRFETGEVAGSGVATAIDIVAWKERYYQYKRKHDKVTLAFQNNRLSMYNDMAGYMLTSAPFGAYTGTNNNTARPDLESRYYIDRNCMDGLMVVQYLDNWQTGAGSPAEETNENWNQMPWLAYSRDPFIIDSFEKVTKVSWMSKDGEPIYNF